MNKRPLQDRTAGERQPPRHRTLAFTVVAIAFVMDLLDVTIVNVALPSIDRSLASGGGHSAWFVAGYSLAFSVLLILGGRLGDLLGHRTMFLVGVGAFTLSSLACGMSGSSGALIAARVAQGGCAALMVPQVMALMQWMYAPHERMRAFAIFGVLGGASSALGPILGGALMDADLFGQGWRIVFLINLPVGLFALVAGGFLLPRDTSARGTMLDFVGTAWCVCAALAWTVPLMQGPEDGWSPGLVAILLSAPLWTLGLWRHCKVVQGRGGVPIVRPSLLGDAGFRRGLWVSMLTTGAVPAYVFALTFSWQLGAGLTPTRMALLCLPIAIGATLSMSWLGRRAFAVFGVKSVVLGLGMQAAGMLLMGAVVAGRFGDPATLALSVPTLAAQALIGLGLGFIGPPLTTATLNGVPLSEAGGASGVVNAVRQLSTAVMVAILAGLMQLGDGHRHQVSIYLAGLPGLCVALGLGIWAAWGLSQTAVNGKQAVVS